MLQVKELSKSYDGKQALFPVTFQVDKGCGLALLGENGSGKSTLLRLLAGMDKADSGAVYYQNNSVLRNRAFLRQHVGYVPQESALDRELTVAEQFRLWQAACGCPRNPESEMLLGLEPLMACRMRTLSGGQLQRVSIALALMNQPSILLMDEATTGLDSVYTERLMCWLEAFLNRGGILIWATHHADEARRLCKLGLHLKDGQMII